MPEGLDAHISLDPFAITPDARVYVPRAATESARKELLRSACNPDKTTALIGPPGLGKTLLLQLLAAEVPEDLRTTYLPYAALPPEELCAWVLRLLGSRESEDPVGALMSASRDLHAKGSTLLLMIDDAGAMPVATARWAGEFLQHSNGRVRMVLAASDNASGHRTIAAIGSNFDVVHLNEAMTESETRKYIDGRLAAARVPETVRARFDDRTVRLLHRVSAGIPRRLHAAAAEILQEAPTESRESVSVEGSQVAEAYDATPIEPRSSEQTLGVPRKERRVASRRAEVDGVPVRVGLGSAPSTGRRAEDRIEPPADGVATDDDHTTADRDRTAKADGDRTGKADEDRAAIADGNRNAVADGDRTAVADGGDSWDAENERDEFAADDFFEPRASIGPTPLRARAIPSRVTIALVVLLVASAAIAIPVIRFLISEPARVAAIDEHPNPRDSIRGTEPEIAIPIAQSERIPEEPRAESSVPNESAGPFAVQINATPWANVEVDGIDLGATPLANIPLFAGAHSFRVRMPDGRVIERTVEIDSERRFISFE